MNASGSGRWLMVLGALFGALGVITAARGAHGADANLSIAANFLLVHAPILLLVPVVTQTAIGRAAGWVLAGGVLLFGGDLAWRSTTGAGVFPMAAPIGGGLMVIGWLALGVALALRR